MPIQLFSLRRVVMLILMLAALVGLADGMARAELARAVEASLNEGGRVVATPSALDD